MEALAPIISWLAPIASTLIITAATASINSRMKIHDQMAEARHAETEEKRKADEEWHKTVDKLLEEQSEALKAVAQDRVDWYAWRAEIVERLDEQDAKLDALTDATQTTMRTSLLHYIEKYLTRGWITPEERSSLTDMHNKYAALNANGFIDGYMSRIAKLPDREI